MLLFSFPTRQQYAAEAVISAAQNKGIDRHKPKYAKALSLTGSVPPEAIFILFVVLNSLK